MTMLRTNLKCNVVYFLFLFFLISLFNTPGLFAASVTLSWAPPTTSADGTPLTDLAGYKIHIGISSGNYAKNTDISNVTSYTVNNLSSGTYYFALTAYDNSGNESSFSNEISRTIDTTTVTYYCDKDKDGYINATADGTCAGTGCAPAGCQTTAGNDCNDNNANINLGASDTNCNGIDNNCNGQVDEGYVPTATTCGIGTCASTGLQQCSNGYLIDTCTSHTSTAEVCDGLDNNCDGQVDEGCVSGISVSKVLLTEDFANGIPGTWAKSGNWNTGNPCGKNIGSPFVSPYAIVDSSCTSTGIEELASPLIDASFCSNVQLAFSNQYHQNDGNVKVDISNDGGANWVDSLLMASADGYPTPDWKYIDIGNIAGTQNAKIKFRYTDNTTDGFWALDNIWATCQPAQLVFSSQAQMPSSAQTIMISNTGADNLLISAIGIEGTDTPDFIIDSGKDACSNKTLLPSESCTLDIVFLPASAGTKSANLSITSNDPVTPALVVPLSGTGTELVSNPIPTIKANGLTGTVNVRKGKRVTVTFELDPGSYVNKKADWWVLRQYGNNWKYYSAKTRKWNVGSSFYYQGPLVEKGPVKVFSSTSMATGQYKFYFGVDTDMNGVLDTGEYYSDVVTVNVK